MPDPVNRLISSWLAALRSASTIDDRHIAHVGGRGIAENRELHDRRDEDDRRRCAGPAAARAPPSTSCRRFASSSLCPLLCQPPRRKRQHEALQTRPSATSCGQNTDSSAPFKTIALSATMKYRAGTTIGDRLNRRRHARNRKHEPRQHHRRQKRRQHGHLKRHLLRLGKGRDHQPEPERTGQIQRQREKQQQPRARSSEGRTAPSTPGR